MAKMMGSMISDTTTIAGDLVVTGNITAQMSYIQPDYGQKQFNVGELFLKVQIMEEVLMLNPEFKEAYEQEIIVRKLKGAE